MTGSTKGFAEVSHLLGSTGQYAVYELGGLFRSVSKDQWMEVCELDTSFSAGKRMNVRVDVYYHS